MASNGAEPGLERFPCYELEASERLVETATFWVSLKTKEWRHTHTQVTSLVSYDLVVHGLPYQVLFVRAEDDLHPGLYSDMDYVLPRLCEMLPH